MKTGRFRAVARHFHFSLGLHEIGSSPSSEFPSGLEIQVKPPGGVHLRLRWRRRPRPLYTSYSIQERASHITPTIPAGLLLGQSRSPIPCPGVAESSGRPH